MLQRCINVIFFHLRDIVTRVKRMRHSTATAMQHVVLYIKFKNGRLRHAVFALVIINDGVIFSGVNLIALGPEYLIELANGLIEISVHQCVPNVNLYQIMQQFSHHRCCIPFRSRFPHPMAVTFWVSRTYQNLLLVVRVG